MSRKAWGLGSLYRRKDGRYVLQTEHRGQRRYVYGRSPSEVRAKARDLPATVRSSSTHHRDSLAEFLEEWLAVMSPPKLGVRTHEGYVAIVRDAIIPVLGDEPLERLGRQDVERAVSVWASQRHPQTVAHYLACLRAALSKAVEWGHRPDNPATKIKTPRIPESRAAAFTEADEARFLAYVEGDDLYPLWLAAFRTGMRQGELLGLRWEDVHFARPDDTSRQGSYIEVTRSLSRSKGQYRLSEPKTNRSRRTIPMGDQLAAVLEGHRKAQMRRAAKKDQGLVFCDPAGYPLPNDRVSRRFSALVREAKVARLTMHSTRHTFATRLLERGVRIDVVMRLLGHSTITTTIAVYGHVTEDAKRAAVAALEGVG